MAEKTYEIGLRDAGDGSKKLSLEAFSDIKLFELVINSRKKNSIMADNNTSSRTNDSSWYGGTKSFEEAQELLHKGDPKSLKKISKANTKTNIVRLGDKAIPTTNIVGYMPHIPNTLAGIPNNMIDINKVKQPVKVVTIIYIAGASASESAKSMANSAKKVMAIIESLEVRGYRCNVFIGSAFVGNEMNIALIKLKDASQALNKLKLSYVLIHPSFERRHMFKWLETYPNLTDSDVQFGYGKPIYANYTWETAKEYFIKHKIMSPTDIYLDFKVGNKDIENVIKDFK